MATLVALYTKPVDPAAFDDYYFSTHVPLAKKLLACGVMRSVSVPSTAPKAIRHITWLQCLPFIQRKQFSRRCNHQRAKQALAISATLLKQGSSFSASTLNKYEYLHASPAMCSRGTSG